MYEQRKVSRELFDLREEDIFWFPKVDRDDLVGITQEIGAGNWYAVVDDIGEGIVVMQIASWPKLDKGNHLRFDEIFVQAYPLDRLQKLVNKERKLNNQPASDRPLRTGDAFSIESADRPGKELLKTGYQGRILDITASAREQAKIALYGAVTRKLTPAEIEKNISASTILGRFQQKTESQDRQDPLGPMPSARMEEF